MIDRDLPLDVQVAQQDKIIKALVQRANQRHELGRSAYSLFQSAITLQSKVSEKTRDLEAALNTLGQTSTELETSEEARNQTEQSLTDALESMEGGFALFTGGRLRVYNDYFKKLIPDVHDVIGPGLSLETYFDSLTKSTYIARDSDAEKLAGNAAQANEAPAPFVFEIKNDRWFVINYRQTSHNNIVVFQTEITSVVRSNRLEKDQLIDAQEHFLSAAFDNMPQGVCTFSSDGTMLFGNARFTSLLSLPGRLACVGTSYAQIVEHLSAHSIMGDLRHDNFTTLLRYLRRKESLHLRRRQKNHTVLEFVVNPLPDGGCIVNVMDVTVQSQTTEQLENRVQERTQELTDLNKELRGQYTALESIEEDLRQAKAEVEAAMSSKTRFFAAASHDLLQPINAAKLLISSLSDMALANDVRDTVQRIDHSFQSMESLLHALLDISRLESVDMKLAVTDFALDGIMRNIANDMGPLAVEKGLRLEVVPSRVWVRSDQRYLSRSVQNLVNNAIQYTKSGRVLLGCRRRGNSVVIEVWDTGVGITKADQERVFQEFTRVDGGSGMGMGLGLSIVQRACAHLGHKVSVRSQPGKGSVFSITLPMVTAGVGAHSDTPNVTSQTSESLDLIVVMIENDPGVLFAMSRRLESWGASVLACTSTEQAVEMVAELGMSPDVILADYQLDHGDTGIESIIALRQQAGAGLPAIIITANQETSIKDLCAQLRISVLTKPVNLSRLRSLIDWKTRQVPRARSEGYDQSLQ
ncbi:signal transduction histidine kinase [Yoonia maritima]|uniref:histidine kinase n=1 Tax=Yoonia maritima TaxID=1435347 RepID=A0A2T0VYK1_9RHOB|nr:PAS-domain containing protein [Yoonia maritima]PRY77163.1 signal transduction histidine kinase [Yoonia maritima]